MGLFASGSFDPVNVLEKRSDPCTRSPVGNMRVNPVWLWPGNAFDVVQPRWCNGRNGGVRGGDLTAEITI